jgi:hypothetical protein
MDPQFDAWIRNMKARLLSREQAAPSAFPAEAEKTAPPRKPAGVPPVGIEDIVKRKNDAYGRMNRLHAQLRWFPSDQGRLEAALAILSLRKDVQRCWKVIDHYNATGKVLLPEGEAEPEPFNPAAYSDFELYQMRMNALKYLSKGKKLGYEQSKPEAMQERREIIQEIERYLNERIRE